MPDAISGFLYNNTILMAGFTHLKKMHLLL